MGRNVCTNFGYISIHALREEGDHPGRQRWCPHCDFYPRPPRGGRQELTACIVRRDLFLSTPSARRATLSMSNSQPTTGNFYPRPPRGGRQFASYARGAYPLFLSTPSARRATLLAEIVKPVELISIHALREEGDLSLFSASCCRPLFLSTPSARRATRGSNDTVHGGVFLSTPSARRATQSCKPQQ